MKSTRRKKWIAAGVFLFIVCNSLLLYFDKEKAVERKSFVHNWSGTFTDDVVESIDVRGVFASNEDAPVYFDDNTGAFQEFFVEVGDEVSEGDELYAYEVLDFENQVSDLELEAAKIEEEITAIDTYLTELESYTIEEGSDDSFEGFDSPFPSDESDEDEDSEENGEDNDNEESTAEAELIQEEAINDKEKERAQKEAELAMVNDQLDQLTTTGQTITVRSTFEGVVRDLSEDLSTPILTLSSTELVVEGEVNEEDRKLIEEEMRTEVTVEDIEDGEVTLPGAIAELDTFSKETDVQKASRYPFEITLTEENEEIRPGYHTDVEVITDEAADAVAAYEDVLITGEHLYAWEMTAAGVLERKEIETGLEEEGVVEITDGLENQVKLADEPEGQFRTLTPFITPIDLSHVKEDELFDGSKAIMKENFLLGIFNR
ncbi:efflux RND transporter periplasmic adaptor subunit [Halobacillus sp. A5]|uniref:efflux RND transporter periplasmic adaptor subunit n=1 Tax=Halobacillus sp. A5 TaxID=2880263 RepID=UPI0020A67114|nr:efflux RND transporter periplasmic adaptor subunit [Halobacillus sp. A5]MCP3029260.1 efflux RND transporter periplasmic adaptor subunit [Halobacillus sp. A5]